MKINNSRGFIEGFLVAMVICYPLAIGILFDSLGNIGNPVASGLMVSSILGFVTLVIITYASIRWWLEEPTDAD